MKIRELMSSPAYTCKAQDSLESAARQLWEHDCGILPVVDRDGRVGAVITDRDICMGALMSGKRLADLRVADSMSRRLTTCSPDDDLAVAVQRMSEHQIHRLPVVDALGKPLGMLSLNDLAVSGAREPAVGREATKVLASVCRHRAAVPMTTKAAAPRAAAPAAAPPKPASPGTAVPKPTVASTL